MQQMHIYMGSSMIMLMMVILMNLIVVAFFTLFERKIMGIFHYRLGPNKVGMKGFLQPFSDALKLLSKEMFSPLKANKMLFYITPLLTLAIVLLMWLLYPFSSNLINFNMSILFFLALMSMGAHMLMLMGWASNTSYSMLGAIRAIAQSISYEITLALSIISLMITINSLDIKDLTHLSPILPLSLMMPISMFILFTSMLAEVNRPPFDFSESESELISGFNVEYGETKFTIIFLAEYASISFMMFIFNLMLFNMSPYNLMFYINWIMMIFFITWVRMSVPRLRYDMLMNLCWFYFLPCSLIMFLYIIIFFKTPMIIF